MQWTVVHVYVHVHVHVYMLLSPVQLHVHVRTTYVCSILHEVQAQLTADLSDKVVALQIDSECADLSNTSSTIALHSDPTRIKKG